MDLKSLIIIWVVAIIFVSWFTIMVYTFAQPENKVISTESNANGLCFKELLHYTGAMNIDESQAGEYSYTLYATSKGIEVWVPCK